MFNSDLCFVLILWETINFNFVNKYYLWDFLMILHCYAWCRTLQNIWQQYISNAVTVENAAYMKAPLHLVDSQIPGYLFFTLIVMY